MLAGLVYRPYAKCPWPSLESRFRISQTPTAGPQSTYYHSRLATVGIVQDENGTGFRATMYRNSADTAHTGIVQVFTNLLRYLFAPTKITN